MNTWDSSQAKCSVAVEPEAMETETGEDENESEDDEDFFEQEYSPKRIRRLPNDEDADVVDDGALEERSAAPSLDRRSWVENRTAQAADFDLFPIQALTDDLLLPGDTVLIGKTNFALTVCLTSLGSYTPAHQRK
jgi:hypothetical protein